MSSRCDNDRLGLDAVEARRALDVAEACREPVNDVHVGKGAAVTCFSP